MEVKLILKSGKLAGKEIPVGKPVFRIGRAEDCHLRPHSDQVSRRHCEIVQEEGHVWVQDCGSSNGTWLNGQRISDRKELKTGDRLLVGPLEFEVRLGVELGGKKKPKVKSIEEAAARVAEGTGKKEDESELVEWLFQTDAKDEKETEVFSSQITQEASPASPPTREQPAPQTPPPQTPKSPGKFAPPPIVAPDTRTAAAETLRRLFQRK